MTWTTVAANASHHWPKSSFLMLLCICWLAWGTGIPVAAVAQDNQLNSKSAEPVATTISNEDGGSDGSDLADTANGKKTFDLSFDNLACAMEKGQTFERSMLPPAINENNGATVRLRGYIKPSFSQSGLTKFVFVRDNKECCFGPGAALYDCVLVRLDDGVSTEYTVRPVTIEGKFY